MTDLDTLKEANADLKAFMEKIKIARSLVMSWRIFFLKIWFSQVELPLESLFYDIIKKIMSSDKLTEQDEWWQNRLLSSK